MDIVRVVKPFRHGTRFFEVGEEARVLSIALIDDPLKFRGKMIYDYYVKFSDGYIVGVQKDEVEKVQI